MLINSAPAGYEMPFTTAVDVEFIGTELITHGHIQAIQLIPVMNKMSQTCPNIVEILLPTRIRLSKTEVGG